jgi:nucleoid DNA-binding protein
MTLTKSHLINAIVKQNGFTHKKSTETPEIPLEIIKSTLSSCKDALISGFSKFCLMEKWKCEGKILGYR